MFDNRTSGKFGTCIYITLKAYLLWYICTVNIFKALESCFSCIAGSCNKDNCLLIGSCLFKRLRKQMRKYLQSHILKSRCWAMPQFKNIYLII